MFIQTQSTQNPSSLMFYPGKPVEIESADFSNVCSALGSPLTKSIYFIDGIVISYVPLPGRNTVFQCDVIVSLICRCGSSFLWVRFRHCDSLMMYRGIY